VITGVGESAVCDMQRVRMMLQLGLLTTALLLAIGCSGAPEPPPPTTTTTTHEATAQELIALENQVGTTDPLPHGVEDAPAPVAGIGGVPGPSPAFGPKTAPVWVFVFTDFQCPVCRRVVEPMKRLVRSHPNDVRMVLKQNALKMHPRAARLAAASIAAFRQGKFWEFYDRAFANQSQNDDQSLIAHAQALGLDVARFQADLDDQAVTSQVQYEAELSASLGLASTPGFLVNGTEQSGWGSYMGIDGIVNRELERAKKIAASGVPADRVAYEATKQSGPKGEQFAAALFTAPH
jgi:protein-disulfide isomerase